jgi:hypothetical protein
VAYHYESDAGEGLTYDTNNDLAQVQAIKIYVIQ